ncbi:acyl-CoA carboxylase subunit beta [Streptomyces sp. Inha503]|uniref:acyl-CoA carboxylase subunit beta n=1 Tax=Streptomyces sp. Inha503 TaxID=3383314 RepID=UPI0039A2B889
MKAKPDAQWETLLDDLESRRRAALSGGGERRVRRERDAGRMTARERIDALADPGTFLEFGTFVTTPGEGGSALPATFLCGLAEIDGRPVAVGAEDFTVQGGGVGIHLARYKGSWGGFIEETALGYGIPLVLLMQGVGGSVELQQEKGYPELLATVPVFPVFDLMSSVPVVTAVLGPTAGSSAARAAISHFSVMTKDNGCLFAGGPPLVKQSLGLEVDKMELGGWQVHARQSGLIDNAVETEQEAIDQLRTFLSYLPSNVDELPPRIAGEDSAERGSDDILAIVSPNGRRAYDAHALICSVVDDDSFFEMTPDYGRSIRSGLARIDGHPVGVLATDNRHLAGAMDEHSSEKQTRFVEICDTFNLPIVYFVDVPGFMIGPDAERAGVLRKGARAVESIHRATVPVYTVQVRRSYGLAGQATGSPNKRSIRLAWPSGTWGDMPVQGGVESAFRQEIAAAEDPAAKRRELLERFAEQTSAWRTVEKFGVEEMIDPRDTRRYLGRLLKVARQTSRPGPKTGPSVRP